MLRSRWLLLIVIVALIAGGYGLFVYLRPPSPGSSADKDLPPDIPAAGYQAAETEFENAYDRKADRNDALSWLGEKSFKAGDWELAQACFQHIPSDTPRYGHIARLYQGRALIKLNEAAKAEQNLLEFMRLEEHSPELPTTHYAEALLQLQYLYGIELRFEERKQLLGALIELGFLEHEEVLNYCFPSLHRWNGTLAVESLERFVEKDPQHPRLRVALGRYRTGQGRLEEARAILEQCRQEYPNSVSTAAALLALLYEEEAWDQMTAIMDQLPPVDDKHPWLLLRMRGHVYNHREEYTEALDCFDRVLKTNPADPESWLGKGAAYQGLGEREKQQACGDKASEMSRIQNRIGGALGDVKDVEVLADIAEIAADLDLHEEADLVVRLGVKINSQHKRLIELRRRLQGAASKS